MSIKKIVRNILLISITDISESAASLYLEKIYVESRKIMDCEYQINRQVKEEIIET